MARLIPEYLTRLQFFVRTALLSIIPLPVELYLASAPFEWSFPQLGALFLLVALGGYWIAGVAVPRAADVGLSRGVAWPLCLIPGVNLGFCLFLLFTKSDAYSN